MKHTNYKIRHIIISAIFIAIGIYLPILFHSIPNGGKIFLPMHLPAMVAAFFLPCTYAFAIGFFTPILSSILTGMPALAPVPMPLILAIEIGTYALVISSLRKIVFRNKSYFSPLIAVIPALIIGRIITMIITFMLSRFLGFKMITPMMFVWTAMVTGAIGIIIQIVAIPPIYRLLVRVLPGWNGQENFISKCKTQKENHTS